jgi:hypothetical protein
VDSERRSGNKCGTAWIPQQTDVTTDSVRAQGLQKLWKRAGLVLCGDCSVRAFPGRAGEMLERRVIDGLSRAGHGGKRDYIACSQDTRPVSTVQHAG